MPRFPWAELDPSANLRGLAGPALYSEPLVLLYDPGRVAPPSRWTALWERTPGRSIALPSPPDPIGIGFAITAARLVGAREGTPSLDAGFDAIAQLTPNVASWHPRPDVYRFISDGNASFGAGWNFPARVHAARLNGHLAMTIPEDGTVSRVTTINLVRGGPAADTARQFIGWLLGGVAQNLMLEKLFLRPVNIRASYPPAALARTVSTGERNSPAMAIDWLWAASMREDIEARWRAIQRGQG